MPQPGPDTFSSVHNEESPSTTSEKARRVKTYLERALSAAPGAEEGKAVNAPALQDFRDQFVLWAGNMGAMHKPISKLSLETRLAGAQGVLTYIHRLLDDLMEAVEDVLAILQPQASSEVEGAGADDQLYEDQLDEDQLDEDDDDGASFADSLMEEIGDALRGLFRAGVLVRKASARDRFAHALKVSRGQFLAQFDLEYVEQKFSKLRRSREESAWLIRRLGNANIKRRQVQKYYRDHKARLAAGESQAMEKDLGDVEARQMQTRLVHEEDEGRTERVSSKATTLVPGQLQMQLQEATLPEENDDSMSLTSAVTTFEKGATLKLPRLATLSPHGEPFECPICFVLCACTTEKAWKIHTYNDIRPYVCTLGGPECEDMMFPDRNSWFQHELAEHLSTFACALCSAKGFDSIAKFRNHVLTHGQLAEEQVNDLLAAGRGVQHEFNASQCPFCDEWEVTRTQRGSTSATGSQLKRHVATHLEQLALFSVPREVIGDPEEFELDSSGGSRGSVNDMGVGKHLGDRYSRTGAMADLEEAIRLGREAVDATPLDHPDRAKLLSNLGNRLGDRYSRTGAMADLEEAIRLGREAVDATPLDHPGRAKLLSNLGNRLGDKYLRTGAMADLEEAIRVVRKAVDATPLDHPGRVGRLNNLGAHLRNRHSRTGAMADLEEAIRLDREAVDATPLDHPDRAALLNNLRIRFGDRYS
ncbi:hypothetical protein RB595_004089 [Gaeumannomyces hyphopodioides]